MKPRICGVREAPFPAVMYRKVRELMVAPVLRSARSQVLFREVNKRIREVVASEEDASEYLCECNDGCCTATVLLDSHEYERIRTGPNHFVVAPGHELLEVERIVHQTDRFVTVEKIVAGRHRGSH